MKLTEGTIARALWMKFGRQAYAAPNIHFFAFESDLLILRKSGLITEYEIKLTKSDFKADFKKKARIRFKKTRERAHAKHGLGNMMTRHEYLEARLGANRFYYVIPEELLPEISVPHWAGLITCRPSRSMDHCWIDQRKPAKLIHSTSFPDSAKSKILLSTYYRYWQNYAIKDISLRMTRTK